MASQKITKATPDELELQVAQAFIDLETSSADIRADLRVLQFAAAKEVEIGSGRKVIIIFVPPTQLAAFQALQQRLTREFEKKFSDRHVVFIAQRRILPKPSRKSRQTQKRPRSRTLTAVHDRMLEDLVFPAKITGKRQRFIVGGHKLVKVFLGAKEADAIDYKLDSFQAVFQKLTGKHAVFEIPAVQATEAH